MALSPQEAAELAALEAQFGGGKQAQQPVAASQAKQGSNGFEIDPNFAAANPGVGFMAGAANKTRETVSQPILRMLAKMGYGPAKQEMEQIDSWRSQHKPVAYERAGEIGADMGLAAATGGAGVVGPAIGMAAQHQLQNYARTGDIKPGEAALDAGAGVALPYVGNKVGPLLKKIGVGAARRGLGVSAKMMKGANPIDIEYALQNRIIPVRGGAAKVKENAGTMLGVADDQTNAALEKLGILFDAPKAAAQARKGVSSRVDDAGVGGILPHQEESALPWLEDYTRQAERMAKKEGVYSDPWDGMLPATLGKKLRQTAQQNAKYNPARPAKEGLDLASEEFARAANNQMDNAVDLAADQSLKSYRQGDKGAVDAYRTAREESRKLTPLRQAAEDEAAKSRRLGLTADIAAGAFGTGLAFHNPSALIPAALAIGGRNLLTSPGGGRMLYEAGRGLENNVLKKGARRTLDLGRSAIFSPNQDDN